MGECSLHRKRTTRVVALAGNLYFLGSRLLTCLTAVLVARLRDAFAWQMRTLALFIRHSCSPFSFLKVCVERKRRTQLHVPANSLRWFMVLDPPENQQNDNNKKNQA
jgi:hypothetical protein